MSVTLRSVYEARSGTLSGFKDFVKVCNNAFSWLRYFESSKVPQFEKAANITSTTKSLISLVDLHNKTNELFKLFMGWTSQSLHVWGDVRGTSVWNSRVVVAGKVGEWGVHAAEVAEFFRSVDLVSVTKEGAKQLKWFSNLSGLAKSVTGLYVEGVKCSVSDVSFKRRAPTDIVNGEVQYNRSDEVRQKVFADWMLTAVKVAMNLAFLTMALAGIAGLLGYVVPKATLLFLSCSTVATLGGIIDHFVSRLCVEPLNR